MALSTPGQKELQNLQDYLNNQPDVLTAIIKHRTSFAGETGALHITTFDPQGAFVNILVHPPQPDGSVKEEMIKLDIEPAIQSPFEARGRMYHWRDTAFRKFGVVTQSPADHILLPALSLPLRPPLTLAIAALLFALLGKGYYADLFRAKIESMFGKYMVAGATIFMVITIKWVLTSAAIGIGGVNEFWESVQYERLRVIYAKTDVGEIPPRIQTAVAKTKKE
ncbi:hypothetical protein EHS25_004665 [Saitozyma podzolica]|uniref:DUF2470 domain-containing protein n=1 Tax=Saitozyma podzolica TaxID=1890683 RepID=A0A427YUZ4_9TREE|nr:hypothetical protein EHS25_004665 [Saitozyma podzolica]